MNNEIKEILDNPKILMLSYGNYISLDDYVKLKDCITNLQEENHNLYKFISEFLGRLEHIKYNGSKTYIKENLELVIEYMNKEFKEYYKLSGDKYSHSGKVENKEVDNK